MGPGSGLGLGLEPVEGGLSSVHGVQGEEQPTRHAARVRRGGVLSRGREDERLALAQHGLKCSRLTWLLGVGFGGLGYGKARTNSDSGLWLGLGFVRGSRVTLKSLGATLLTIVVTLRVMQGSRVE